MQVGLLLQRSNKLRAGCRFALRVAETPEEVAAIRAERAETGVAWTKYEVPDDIELDRKAYPGLLTADSIDGGSGGPKGREDEDDTTDRQGNVSSLGHDTSGDLSRLSPIVKDSSGVDICFNIVAFCQPCYGRYWSCTFQPERFSLTGVYATIATEKLPNHCVFRSDV